jgi:hypothetical protein
LEREATGKEERIRGNNEGRNEGRSPPLRLCKSTVEDILMFVTANICMKNLLFFSDINRLFKLKRIL